jgi:23S rRNA pseudouridine2605 synthase
VTISEGRNREVRRMMEAVGHAVSRLIRIRYGAMVLPHGLRRGAWLELDEADIRSLMRAAGTSERPRPVSESAARTNRNDRRPRTGGQGRAGSAVPRAKPAAKPNQAPGGSGLHAKSDAPKPEARYIGAESFNRLKKAPGGTGRGGRGGAGRSR